jgi:hypothetical protein
LFDTTCGDFSFSHFTFLVPQRKLGGISVEALRGESGADFEGNAAVLRGAPKKDILKRFLPLFFDERDFVAYGEVREIWEFVFAFCVFLTHTTMVFLMFIVGFAICLDQGGLLLCVYRTR